MSGLLGSSTRNRRMLPFSILMSIVLMVYTLTWSNDLVPRPSKTWAQALTFKRPSSILEKSTWEDRQNVLIDGRWVKEGTERSLKELESEFGSPLEGSYVPPPLDDDGIPMLAGDQTSETEIRELNRSQSLLNQVWTPRSESEAFMKLDPLLFMEKALGSDQGVVIVGDSISLQMYETLRQQLRTKFGLDVLSQTIDKMEGLYPQQLRLYLTLPPNDDPMYTQLREVVNGREDRLKLPVLTFLRSDWLVTVQELEGIVAENNFSENWSIDPDIAMFDEPWLQLGQDLKVSSSYEKNRPVWIFNTGAHFGPYIHLRKEDLQPLYKKVVEKMISKISSLPSNPIIIYRATSPGHQQCWSFHQPSEDLQTMEVVANGSTYDWDKFSHYNQVWKDAIQYIHQPNSLVYLDIWPMSLSRPEAHRLAPADCLHWATGSVPGSWNNLMWTLLRDMW